MTVCHGRCGAAHWAAIPLLVGLLAVAVAVATHQSALGRDIAGRQLAEEALAVAQALADERLLRFARAANEPGTAVFSELRSTAAGGLLAAGPGAWAGAAAVDAELGHGGMPLTSLLLARLSAGERRFAVRSSGLRITVEGGAGAPEPQELRGRVEVDAQVEGAALGRTILRSVRRVQGFRVSRLGLPWPFDSLALFVGGRPGVLGTAPALAREIGTHLDRVRASFAAKSADVLPHATAQEKQELAELDVRLAAAAAFFGGPDNGIPWQQSSFLLRLGAGERAGLAELSLANLARTLEDRIRQQSRAIDALDGRDLDDPAPVRDTFGGYLAAIDELRTGIEQRLARWVKVAQDSRAHAEALQPGLETLDEATGVLEGGAWFTVPSLGALDALLALPGEPVPARRGVIRLEDTRVLTGAALAGRSASRDRLLLLCPGRVQVSDVPASDALVTVVADGPLTVAGEIHANLVARHGLTIAPGARIAGNVVVLDGDVELGAGASLTREERTFRASPGDGAAPVLYHVALDPGRLTAAVDAL